jgi:hypothetical protein
LMPLRWMSPVLLIPFLLLQFKIQLELHKQNPACKRLIYEDLDLNPKSKTTWNPWELAVASWTEPSKFMRLKQNLRRESSWRFISKTPHERAHIWRPQPKPQPRPHEIPDDFQLPHEQNLQNLCVKQNLRRESSWSFISKTPHARAHIWRPRPKP